MSLRPIAKKQYRGMTSRKLTKNTEEKAEMGYYYFIKGRLVKMAIIVLKLLYTISHLTLTI